MTETIEWLLGQNQPGVRYLVLREVLDFKADNTEYLEEKQKAHVTGPIAEILSHMTEAGYWVEPGPGYNPKYLSTVWSLIHLSQLGADLANEARIERACLYILDHALTAGGQFSTNGAPSGTADCLQGNLCAALIDLGCRDDRLIRAYEWMARTVTGEGLAPVEDRKAERRYYAGKCGPTFRCGSNNKLPCAWGAAKVMLAFGKLPDSWRTPLIDAAIQQGIDFLFSVDPADAAYPSGWAQKPSSNWWKFGFPVFYVTDILQIFEALALLGYGSDPRLRNALAFIESKRAQDGSWSLEYDYSGKTWVEHGKKKMPNPWVTIRALRALKICAETNNK